jgi:putative ABC transport system substrate-binding protein
LEALAIDLARQGAAVIAGNGPVVRAAMTATPAIPIVFVVAADPVERRLVASLRRPGSNVTGIAALATETGPKRLELLHRLVPSAHTLPVLLDPNDENLAIQTHDLQEAAQILGLTLRVQHAGTERDLEDPRKTW